MEISKEEELLVIRALQKDAAAIQELIHKNQSWLYSLALRITQDGELSQKAVIQAFTNALNALRPFSQKKTFRALLAHHLLKILKASESEKSLAKKNFFLPVHLSQDRKTMLSIFINSLQQLRFKERTLLLLRDLGNLSFKEIEDAYPETKNAAPKQILEARLKLRHLFSAYLEKTRQAHGL